MIYVVLILALAAVVVVVVYSLALGLANKASKTDDLLDRLEWEARQKQRVTCPPDKKP